MLLLAATEPEVVKLKKEDLEKKGATLSLLGMGKQKVFATLPQLLKEKKPQAILLVGFSGGLSPHLKAAALTICTSFCHLEEGEPPLSSSPHLTERAMHALDKNGISYTSARSLTTPKLLTEAAEKQALASRAEVVDLESYWVAQIAQAEGVPLAALRVVFDPADQPLPPYVADLLEEHPLKKLTQLLRALLSAPQSLFEGPKLARLAARAQERLCQATLSILDSPLSEAQAHGCRKESSESEDLLQPNP